MKTYWSRFSRQVFCLCLASVITMQPIHAFFQPTYNPDSQSSKIIIEAINEGNTATLSSELQNRSNKLNKTEQLHFLFKAVNQNKCQDEIVKLLVSTNKKKTSQVSYKKGGLTYPMSMRLILGKATEKNCANEVRSLISISNDSDILFALDGEQKSYSAPISFNEIVKRAGNQKETLDHLYDMIEVYADYFSEKKKTGMSTEIESALKKFLDVGKTAIANIEKRTQSEKYQNSPEGLNQRAYELVLKIKKQKQYIEHQKQISNLAGVVDKSVLYEAADNIIFYEKELNKVKQLYKETVGSDLLLPTY